MEKESQTKHSHLSKVSQEAGGSLGSGTQKPDLLAQPQPEKLSPHTCRGPGEEKGVLIPFCPRGNARGAGSVCGATCKEQGSCSFTRGAGVCRPTRATVQGGPCQPVS